MKKMQRIMLIICILVTVMGFKGENTCVNAADIVIKIEQEKIEYTGEEISVVVDGEESELSMVPALQYEQCFMVPCEALLKEYLKVTYTYEEATGTIQMVKGNTTIVMAIGSKEAYVNTEMVQLETAPFICQIKKSDKQEVYVPVEVVAEHFEYGYSVSETLTGKMSIQLSSPVEGIYNGEAFLYSGEKIREIIYNGESYSLNGEMIGIEMNGTMMLPVEEALQDSPIKANVEIKENKILVSRGTANIELQVESRIAYVNGVEQQLPEAVHQVIFDGIVYYMVPAEFIMEAFGADSVTFQNSEEKLEVEKETGVYLEWANLSGEGTENGINSVVAKKSGKKDLIVVKCNQTPKIKINKTKEKISVLIKNVTINQEYEEKVYDALYTRNISIKQDETDVVLSIKKKSGVNFICQSGEGNVKIFIGVKPVKIAVDCGHGANTPGKRSPKMPCDIDFDGDGKVDVKKGQSIREHQGNVGVGKYLANELERCGFEIYRSAFGKKDISLSQRQKNIKKFGAKYSVSVHFNAAGTGSKFNSVSGVETFYHRKSGYAKASKSLAKKVLKEMAKGTKQINRGAKSMELAMCNTSRMGTNASILVECAFMTNYHEAKNLFGNANFWKEPAKEIAKAMCEYSGVEYLEE